MKKDLKYLLFLILSWRLALLLIGWASLQLFFTSKVFYFGPTPNWISAWSNWDGGHFVGIAQNGYLYDIQYAFLPLYPFLVRLFSFIVGNNFFYAGLLVSNLSLIGFVSIFYLYVRHFLPKQSSLKAVILMMLFPTAFFLAASFAESTFLLSAILALYFSTVSNHPKRWTLSWIFALASSLTRLNGFLIILMVLFQYLRSKPHPSIWKIILFGMLSSSGIILWILFLQLQFNDPLLFSKVQTYWSRNLYVVDPVNTLAHYISEIFSQNTLNFNRFLDLIFMLSGISLSLYSFKKISPLLSLYCLLTFLIPLLSGTFISSPRFFLSAFPLFMTLAIMLQNNRLFYLVATVSGILLIIFTGYFINGFWIA